MNGLRDLVGADCGQQSALQQLSSNVTQVNPNVLAEAQVYKQAPLARQNGPNPMEMQHRPIPTPNDLVSEFQRAGLKPQIPNAPNVQPNIQMQRMHAQQMNQQQMNNILSKEFENKLKIEKAKQNQNNIQNIQKNKVNNQVALNPRPTMMGQPINMMPNLVNIHEQMYQNFAYGMPQQGMIPQPFMRNMPQISQQQKPVISDKKQESKEGISTNGEQDMKDSKTVEDELNNLNPSYSDVNAINNLLNETSNDPKMQNSQFFNFLKRVKENPAVPDQKTEEDMSAQWQREFQNWRDNTELDDANWQSYLDSVNPLNNKPKDPQYAFAENNKFINENENSKTSDEYFKEGLRLMKEGNLNDAILAFEACVKLEETRSDAWRYLGICHADNEKEQDAIAAFLKCLSYDSYDLDALLQLGVSYTNEIDPYRALKYLKTWIGSHADYSVLLSNSKSDLNDQKEQKMNNVNALQFQGSREEHSKIVQLFNKALTINNKDADLHIVLGVLYNITSDYDKAEFHFKKAIQARPQDPSLWNKLGATQANGQNCAAAIKAYSKALKLKPNYVRALSNLGISFANQNMHREACQSYLASLERNPKAETVWDHLTMSLLHMNRSDLVSLCEKRDPSLFKKYFRF